MDSLEARRYRVTMISANIKTYRATFFPMLRDALAAHGIDLTVLYSDSNDDENKKGDSIELPLSLGKKVPCIYMLHNRVLIQFPPMMDLVRSHLVIIVNASGYLFNYPLLLLSRLGLKKVAFWGHGRNMQGNPESLSERLKRRLANATDWWFAYTRETACYLESIGVSAKKITPIENAVDTKGFRESISSITVAEVESMRSYLGIRKNDRIGLYCGSLYKEKRIPYLMNVAARIVSSEPRFRLLVVGGGSQAHIVQNASHSNPSIIYAGPLFGRDKAICFKIAELFLNPGLVGLGILDSFAAGLPFLTTAEALHSPEIAYLENGKNGLIISGNEEKYAAAVIELLNNKEREALLRQGTEKAASRYTVENMVQNVVTGIVSCLRIRD